MTGKITKRGVDALTPGDRDVFLWDGNLTGFGVRCRPSGSRYYLLKMRVNGRQRWITIGKHGAPWTPVTARREAERLLGEKATGRDPAKARDMARVAGTIEQLGQRFLDDYVPAHCKDSTAYEYRRAVELFITPALGQHRIIDLERPDVSAMHHELRDKPYQANRALGVLSKMMNLAEEWGLRPDGTNPTLHVKRFTEEKRKRYLNTDELKQLGSALKDADADDSVSPFAVAAIRLLIFTGARSGEVLNLRWADVDLDRGVLELPDSKTGAKSVYLNDAAIQLLRSLPRLDGNPFVIPGVKPGARLNALQKPWRKLRRAAQ